MTLIRHADFRRLWAGDALSQVGTQVTFIAMPLLAVKVLDANAFEVGVLAACEFAAFLLIGLPAGVWVDRSRRRNVLIGTDLARAALLGSVPAAWAADVLTLTQLYVVVLLAGCCTVFFDVAYQSYLPHLVGRDHLVEGNAKLQGTQSVAQIGGPSIGGFLVQWLTAPYAVLVDAVSYLWSAAWLGAIRSREPRPERAPDRHLGREMAEGLGFVFRHRLLRSITMTTAICNLFNTIGQTVLIVLLADADQLNLSSGTIGLLFSVQALGGLVGAFAARRVAGWIGQGTVLWLSIAVSSPLYFTLPFIERGWLLVLCVGALSVYSFGVVVYNVTQVSFRQALCPERLLGRMNATIRFVVWGTMPIGALVGGTLGSVIGLRPALWVAAIGGMFGFLPIWWSPLRWMRTLPESPEQAADLAEPGMSTGSTASGSTTGR